MEMTMYLEQKVDLILAKLEGPPVGADAVIAQAKKLSPEDQVRLLEALGLRRRRLEHAAHCTTLQGSGLICTCTPPESHWINSAVLRIHFGETWEKRKDAEIARDEAVRKAEDAGENYQATWGLG